MKNEIKEIGELLKSIEDYKNPTKMVCKQINELRRKVDGQYEDSCFCARSSRSVFISDSVKWYNSL